MKRPWFQYHLSTAIVLMFVAGGLMGANFQPRVREYADVRPMGYGLIPPGAYLFREADFGWPQTMKTCGPMPIGNISTEPMRDPGISDELLKILFKEIHALGDCQLELNEFRRLAPLTAGHIRIERTNVPVYPTGWFSMAIALNLLTALAILAATAFVCEWLIRRRKPHPQPLSSEERGAGAPPVKG